MHGNGQSALPYHISLHNYVLCNHYEKFPGAGWVHTRSAHLGRPISLLDGSD